MGSFPEQVYGKTGTAQRNGQQDQSWYACFVPSWATRTPIVVVVTVEQGGFGALAAAPAARQILSQWFFGKRGSFVAGYLQDAMSTRGRPMSVTPIHTLDEPVAVPRQRTWILFDPLLALSALGLLACSLVTLRGATRTTLPGQPLYYVERQAIYAAVGIALAMLLSRMDYSRLREYKLGFYALLIALNIVVFGMPAVRGAHRWIPLPFLQVQPSEFGKVLLIVSLAAFAVDRSRRLHERRTTARIMLLALVPALLVIPQPDLGTGLVFVAVGFTILFFAGTSWKQLTALVAMFVASVTLVLAGAPALGVHVLKPYQVQRLTGFLNPSHDPRNQTYNITESLIAIGSGQKTGRGVAHATQTSLHFLPENQTDFVFAVVGETYGFVGAALVLVALRVDDLAHAAHPDDGQEPVRHADRRRNPGDADVPGLRQRRHDDRDHAHHRSAVTADELWRLLGARHVHRPRPAAVDLRPITDLDCDEGQGPDLVTLRRVHTPRGACPLRARPVRARSHPLPQGK